MALARNALGRFGRQAETTAPSEPAAPPPDGVAMALERLRQAELAVSHHGLELAGIRERIRASQEERADCILKGDPDGALTAESEARRSGIRWEIESARAPELSAAVDRARARLREAEWRRLQPRLHDAHTALTAAALALVLAIEEARNLEQAARNLGASSVPDTPAHHGLNGHVVDTWARAAWHAQSQQSQQAA
jgi:hypothetical protein